MQSRLQSPFAKVTLVTPGVPVRMTAAQSDPTDPVRTPALFVQAGKANVGIIYVGISNVTANLYIIALSAGEAFPLIAPQVRGNDGEVFINDYWIDGTNATDFVMVSQDIARSSE